MERNSKKILSVLVSIISVFIFYGCSEAQVNNTEVLSIEQTTKFMVSNEDTTQTSVSNVINTENVTNIVQTSTNNKVQNNKTNLLERVGIEKLTDRALTAIDLAGDKGAQAAITTKDTEGKRIKSGVYLSWRYFEEDTEATRFTLYRNEEIIADNLINTNYVDIEGKYGDIYKIVGNNDTELGLKQIETPAWQNFYLEIELNAPAPQQLPNEIVEFSANDMSLADLDNDGQLELVVKWEPDNSKDNSLEGITGYTYLDGYDIDFRTGKAIQLWRIDLGPNIRSGAHYTQYMVWDMDNDGIAEIACKTADGSTTYKSVNGELQETGYVGACNSLAINSAVIDESPYDYRISTGKALGKILEGKEYLTIFKGDTGEIIDTVEFYPQRGDANEWGDDYGNRVDRFLACVAYLDGENPSMVFSRGYYTRVTMAAYRLIDNKLTQIWHFDSNEQENNNGSKQGNHNISVADVDGDEKDEIIYGAMVIDDDGTIKYNTNLGHGDAMHVGDLLPSREGLEVFTVHETKQVEYQVALRDANTGELLFAYRPNDDIGRGVASDIDPRYEGAELWSSADNNVYSAISTFENVVITSEGSIPAFNYALYWDGDLLRELLECEKVTLDGSTIKAPTVTKWDYQNNKSDILFKSSELVSYVGTNNKLGIIADVMGDWREELISQSLEDRNKIRIYMSTIETDYTIPCLLQDEMYRLGIAWQNVAYNQPAHLSYSLTEGVKTSVITVDNKIGTETVNNVTNNLVENSEINLSFTEASDGIWGYEIEGYELYRKKGNTSYEKIATLDKNTFIYTDKDVSAGETVNYKIAAIVNRKTSYYSLPITVKISDK